MIEYIVKDAWKIIKDKFHVVYNRIRESPASLGNSLFGQRGNFQEYFSGDSHFDFPICPFLNFDVKKKDTFLAISKVLQE